MVFFAYYFLPVFNDTDTIFIFNEYIPLISIIKIFKMIFLSQMIYNMNEFNKK